MAAAANEDEYHSIGISSLDVIEANRPTMAGSIVLALYQHTPCSWCRARAVELLHDLKQLPEWIIEECLFDANPDLRAWAREHLGQGLAATPFSSIDR